MEMSLNEGKIRLVLKIVEVCYFLRVRNKGGVESQEEGKDDRWRKQGERVKGNDDQ